MPNHFFEFHLNIRQIVSASMSDIKSKKKIENVMNERKDMIKLRVVNLKLHES